MEQSLLGQALSLARFLGLGLALGLVYDLLRPARYSAAAAWIWDGLFCALSALAFFLLNLSENRGGIWETALLLLAFCAYIHLLSPLLLPLILKIHRLFLLFFRRIKDNIRKIFLFIKKLFSKP